MREGWNQEKELPGDLSGKCIWFGTNEDGSKFYVDLQGDHVSQAEAYTRTGLANTTPVEVEDERRN